MVTSYSVTNQSSGVSGSIGCTPQFETAGLTLGAVVEKIDDNGFVTFSVAPTVAAAVAEQDVGGCGPIAILNERKLTGALCE